MSPTTVKKPTRTSRDKKVAPGKDKKSPPRGASKNAASKKRSLRRTPARTGSARTSSVRTSSARTTSSRKSPARTPARRSTPARKSSAPAPELPPMLDPFDLWRRLSLDRKLDIIGIFLALVGLVTLLSLVSVNRSSLTSAWIGFLDRAFGWGTYLLPGALLLVGLWLILRNFERIPWPSVERIFGALLLFLNILGWMHFALNPGAQADAFSAAQSGTGGGYTGAAIYVVLERSLGRPGAATVLVSWLLVALTLGLDDSILGLFRWLAPVGTALGQGWESLRRRLLGRLGGKEKLPRGYTPMQPQAGVETVSRLKTAPERPTRLDKPLINPLQPLQIENMGWTLPPLDEMLDESPPVAQDEGLVEQRARLIEETLASFGAPAHVVDVSQGPTITQFGVEPDFVESRGGRMRVRVGKIAALADDLALALAAKRIRIQAPVPGKGYVGIEVPNEKPNLVSLRSVLESEAVKRLKSPLRFALGQDVAGNAVAADLAAMPHLLIAGATGSGKSVCVNSIIACMLANNTPDELRLVMVDPKRVELTGYNGIPHLLAPVVVELERVVAALQWITREMDMRYQKFAGAGARNLADYNERQKARGEKKLPYLVIIIDELADLMMLAPDETERAITRIAQLARATGIHLVIATQRPSVDVVTGLIKANFPARIAFAVASGVDSRVILDQPGAERLLGSGDMLFQAPDAPAPVRLQGVYVSDREILRLVQYWRGFLGAAEAGSPADEGPVDSLPGGVPLKQMPLWESLEAGEESGDPLLDEAIDLIRSQKRASISMLQRKLRIGYTRAARLVELLEEKGIVSAPEPGTGTRRLLEDEANTVQVESVVPQYLPQENDDPMLPEAIDLARRQGRASINMLQHRLRVDFEHAEKLIAVMLERRVIGPEETATGTHPVIDYGPAAPPIEV